MKKMRLLMLALVALCASYAGAKAEKEVEQKVIVAYVTSWSQVMPDPTYITHINYAFGHVNDTFNGVRIDNEERLRQIVALKQQKPDLKVLVSIGGWESGRFSEMAGDKKNRKSFAKDCKRIVKEFGLDGIDIDWEYPTSSAAGISSSPADKDNFTLMMKDIRKAIGKKKLLTLATDAGGKFYDFRAFDKYIDFVNIMSYDMANAPQHHSALYRSANAGPTTTQEAIDKHLAQGVPANKLTMGMPFYGRGSKEFAGYMNYGKVAGVPGFTERWDEVAQVPYMVNGDGTLVFGYENPRSIAIKTQYLKDRGLLGAMYWEYSGDNEAGDLRRTIYNVLFDGKTVDEVAPPFKVLVLTERGGQHGGFTDAGLKWLAEEGKNMHFEITEINNAKPITEEYLAQFKVVVQLDFPPYTWPKEAEEAFIKYIDEGRGGWVGFHHATLLGEFDGYPLWQWFSDFMGGIRFKNYIAPLADGTVKLEDAEHPVMRGVSASFVLSDDEWYTFDKSPRPNVHVLATVDESTYRPASDIKMGDHPVVWVNQSKKARNAYFLMGHSKKLYDVKEFTAMFRNAIRWAAGK